MNNKIFLKIGIVLSFVVLTYVLFIVLIISPNITTYLTKLETKHALSQLHRVETIIKLKEQYVKDLENTSTNKHKQDIRKISLQAYNIMNIYYEMYQKKVLTKEEALSYSFEEISNIRYGHKDDYLFILDRNGKLVFHPDKRFHLTNIYNKKDANGNLFVDRIISNSIKNHETYTRYSWVKLNSDNISEKIVHSFYFMPFDLVISSGVYIDNIKIELEAEKKKIVLDLDNLIKSIELGETGYVVVMNGKNRVIIHPNKKLINADLTKVKEPNSNNLLVDN